MKIEDILNNPDDVSRKVVNTFFLFGNRVVYCGGSKGFVLTCYEMDPTDSFHSGKSPFTINLTRPEEFGLVEFGVIEPLDFNLDDHVVYTQRKLSKSMSVNTNKDRILFSKSPNLDQREAVNYGFYYKCLVNPGYADWKSVYERVQRREIKSVLIAPNVIMRSTNLGIVTFTNRENMSLMWVHKDKATIVDNEFVHEYLGSKNLTSVRVLQEIIDAL